MTGLWADGWFYISSAGLLISGILFFFLLGQYRAASEAADLDEVEAEAPAHEAVAVSPVTVRDEPKAASVASVHSEPAPALKAEEPKTEPYSGPDRRKDPATTTGGISPAVVYLQNIKLELNELHQEVKALAKRVDDELGSVSNRDEALIERLAELTRVVESLKSGAPAAASEPAPAPAPKKKAAQPAPAPAPKPEPAPAPEPVVEPKIELTTPAGVAKSEAPVPAPKTDPITAPAPKQSPDETIRMELGNLISPEKPAADAPADAPAEEKPRRGPVWPV